MAEPSSIPPPPLPVVLPEADHPDARHPAASPRPRRPEPWRALALTHGRPARLRRVAKVVHWRAMQRWVAWRTAPLRRRAATVVIAAAAVAAAVLVGGYVLAGASPSWWRSFDPADPRSVQTARAVEDGAWAVLTEPRPPAPSGAGSIAWRAALAGADASAWLNLRLPRWLESRGVLARWPEEIRELQVRFDAGLVHVAARVGAGGEERYLSAVVRPRVDESGALWLPAERLGVGRVGVPASWVLSDIGQTGPDLLALREAIPRGLRERPETAAILAALAGREPMALRPVVRLPDGRRVHLVRIESAQDRLIFTCRTDDPRPPAP